MGAVKQRPQQLASLHWTSPTFAPAESNGIRCMRLWTPPHDMLDTCVQSGVAEDRRVARGTGKPRQVLLRACVCANETWFSLWRWV